MRVTTLFNRLLDLPGVTVADVSIGADTVTVQVSLRARRLACPHCGYTTRAVYDTRERPSRWRHADFGRFKVELIAGLRRLECPEHGVLVQAVPFARHRCEFTREFEQLVAFLATKMDKTAICRLLRIDWDTVGRICARVVADGLDPSLLDGLVRIGVDEVSYKRHHHYLTLITDHVGHKIVWGAEGKDAATLDAFYAELGPERAADLEAVSMDMGAAFVKSTRANAPNAVRCIDPFHAVKIVGEALDRVRRATWQGMRRVDPAAAHKFKGARWSLLKRPDKLTDDQAGTLRRLRRRGGELWRAYTLKEAFREIFDGDLDPDDAEALIDRWISKASRSRIPAFVTAAKTIRKFRDGIVAALKLKINNGRAEGLNNHVRLITRRAYGFHSAQAALALIMLSCGPIQVHLPHEESPG